MESESNHQLDVPRKEISRGTTIILLVGAILTLMSAAAISPSLPEMATVFYNDQQSEFLVKLVLTIPALFIAIGGPIVGIIIDRWGRKPMLVFSIILYGISGASGFFFDSLVEILISRALFGFAVAGIMTTSFALVGDYYEGSQRNRIIGLQSAFGTFGGVMFLLAGGYLADISWKAPFLIYLLAFALLPLVIYFIKEPNIPKRKQIQEKRTKEKTSYLIFPLAFLSMVIVYLTPLQIPFYLKELGDISNTEIGIAIASTYLSAGVTSIFYKKIKSKLSFQNIFMLSFLFSGVGHVLVSLSGNYNGVVSGLVVGGIGLGLLIPNMFLWLMSKTPEQFRGRAIGSLLAFVFLGQFFSSVVSQSFIEQLGSSMLFGIGGAVLLTVSLMFVGISFRKKYEKWYDSLVRNELYKNKSKEVK